MTTTATQCEHARRGRKSSTVWRCLDCGALLKGTSTDFRAVVAAGSARRTQPIHSPSDDREAA